MSKPRSINTFLLDGDPNGIRVAQISMSKIQAIAFRRNQLRRVREAFPELDRPGVYKLIEADCDAKGFRSDSRNRRERQWSDTMETPGRTRRATAP